MERKDDCTTFALRYAIKKIHSEWVVLDDSSTRILYEVTQAQSSWQRGWTSGWALHPGQNKTSAAMKAYLQGLARSYYDAGKVLRGHKAMAILYDAVNDAGLPKFMPNEYPSTQSCVSMLVSYQQVYNQYRTIHAAVDRLSLIHI